MTSSTIFTEEQLAQAQPVENEMYTREGFGRKNYRYQFANASNLSLTDTFVEEEERTYVNPDTSEMPHGPTGMGEVGGSGVDFVRQDGDVTPTYRFVQGFSVLDEELQAGAVDLGEQRRYLSEMLDFFADSMWFKGISNSQGTQVQEGMFSWLKSAIPAERTFDCENYDGDSGDKDYLTNDTQENLIKYDAYEQQSGELLDDGDSWGLMIGRQQALANFQKVRPADGGIAPRDTYWDAINADNGPGVGVNDYLIVPDKLRFTEAPEGQSPLEIDLTTELGPDEVILLPSLDQVRENYWRLRQMPEPHLFDPVSERGGQTRFDYAWRYAHSFDPKRAYSSAQDSVHITNVSVLFQ